MAKLYSTKRETLQNMYKTLYRKLKTPQKTEGELMCSGRVGSSCYTTIILYFPLTNEVAKGYSNATVHLSFLPSVLP